MSLIAKLLLSLVIAVIASTLVNLLFTGEIFDGRLLIAFFVSTAATALIVGAQQSSGSSTGTAAAGKPARRPVAQGQDSGREHGTVKWFNASKGFGFIVKDDGEEIFVHFRSIRGEGRRGLRDGQSVTFIVADSEKGPQAEDVVGEE
ncbi:MAG: cold shock domain-containing protein [Halioglobus sp.]|nr:cold shock domain-containing protein [Halioglobus sp.]